MNSLERFKTFAFGSAVLCFGWIYLHLIAFWPGFISYDTTFNTVQFLTSGESLCDNTWKSYIYGCLLQLSLISPWGFALTTIVQALLISCIVGWGFYFVAKKWNSLSVASFWAGLMILMPTTGFMAIFTERDVLYSWIYLVMVVLAFGFFSEPQKKTRQAATLLLFSAIFLGCLRREGLVPLLLLVFFVPLQFKKYWKGLIWSISVTLFFGWLLNYGIPKMTGITSLIQDHNRYNITAYWGALNEIRRNPNSRIFPGDKAFLEKLAPISQIQALKEGEFGGALIKVPGHEVNRLHRTAFRTIVRNFDLFLESRWKVLYASWFPAELFDYFHDTPSSGSLYPDLVPFYPQIVPDRVENEPLRTGFFDLRKNEVLSKLQSFFYGSFLGIVFCFALVILGLRKRELLLTFSLPLLSFFAVALTHGTVKPKVYYFLNLLTPFMLLVLFQHLGEVSLFHKRGLQLIYFLRTPLSRLQNYFSKVVTELKPPDLSWITGSDVGININSIKKASGSILKILLSFFFMFLLMRIRNIDFEKILSQKPNEILLGFLLLNQLLMCVISAIKWSAFQERSGDPIPLHRIFTLSWISQSIGIIGFGILGADGFRAAYLNLYEGKAWGTSLKNIFLDRLTSLAGLVIVLLTGLLCLGLREVGLLGFFLIFAFPVRYRILVGWGTLLQVLKVISIMTVFLLLEGTSFAHWYQGVFRVSVGLFLELVPVSFEGLGWGHYTFYELFDSQNGTTAYHSFFLAKVIFKLFGVLMLVPALLFAYKKIRARFAVASTANERLSINGL